MSIVFTNTNSVTGDNCHDGTGATVDDFDVKVESSQRRESGEESGESRGKTALTDGGPANPIDGAIVKNKTGRDRGTPANSARNEQDRDSCTAPRAVNSTARSAVNRAAADSENAARARAAGGIKKARVQQQLHRVIEGLTVSQANVLLLQAMSLAAGGADAECGGGDYRVSALQSLSKRELEVLVLVANGYNRKSIGGTLGISVNTAARHIANIYSKLGISSVAEATSFAYQSNVIGSMQTGRSGVALRQ